MRFIKTKGLALALSALTLTTAHAGVIIGGTRIIFDGAKKEASISITNPDSAPYLIQSWIDMQEGNSGKAPFIITPPLYRLDGGQKNIERIVMTGALPQEQESLFWLNIKAIPSASKQTNALQIAVKTRIKLIYRPEGLRASTPEEQANKLTWQRAGNEIQVNNPTQYVVNFNEITLGGKKLDDVTYVLPGASARFVLPNEARGNSLTFKIINDYGSPGVLHQASL
ncbi:long polar fimbrial chaperone LpfB [Enterobacter cloacae subsp. cloacae]|uniref:Molecular chaperone n=1 Tax=Enterobacter cloacae TaxID=550 RepID=A0A427KMW0_ENTCL|nr:MULTISPECIES: molecular chaperone [Enterobacter]AFM59604.1 chaperone protein LpfB [Enterobacter cloacae subsp. dissolvens SDM]ELE9703363.1 molecular chaperone [Enterobacter cloacae]ELK7331568.1 molecular chaperone [Enterobacter cloacae]ELK7440466.1 molecular chaperone [Enterobacter cloacae]KLQ37697.1 long polar fimbrial chaperone LpfB [Enterobacter cloacae subsp. dissolvens]